MAFNANDTAHVSRGTHRGKRVTVLSGPDAGEAYAVKTEDGDLAVIRAVNLKAPAEAQIPESRLAQELQTLATDLQGADVDRLQDFVSRLGDVAPGLGARIAWPSPALENVES